MLASQNVKELNSGAKKRSLDQAKNQNLFSKYLFSLLFKRCTTLNVTALIIETGSH